MRALDQKLRRDLWHLRGQCLAIGLVIASGVATFVMSLNTLRALASAQDAYYERYGFADVFATLTRAPLALQDRIESWPGIARVEPRIVMEVTMDVPGVAEPAVARLISLPDRRSVAVNRLHIREGRLPEPGRRGEVAVGEAFTDAHDFHPGDHVEVVMNGRLERLTIVGIVLSPEYVFQLRGGDMLPDDRRFAVMWMSEQSLAAAFDMDGAFNNVCLTLRRDASREDTIARLDRLLEPYGSSGAYGRDEHVSYRYLRDEIKQLKATGLVVPIIFLGVAAFLLNVVMSRLINTQREEIAALKAFGYSRREIGRHYLTLVSIVVLAGVAVGCVAGSIMGHGLTRIYTMFYRFPHFSFSFDFGIAAISVVIAVVAGAIGTGQAIRRAVARPPAEAMRPEPPAVYRATVIERMGLARWLPQTLRMILRQLERRPVRTLLSALGIGFAVAVLVLGNFGRDAIDELIAFQFERVQREDMMVTFVDAQSADVVHEVRHLPGVLAVEPFRVLPVRLRYGHRSKRIGLFGLVDTPRLHRPLDAAGRPVIPGASGLIISEKLAELLAVEAGDTLIVEVLEGERPVHRLPVERLVMDYAGTNAYMAASAIHRLQQEDPIPSGVFLAVDARVQDELYTTLKATPRVGGVSVREAVLESFDETIAENQFKIQSFNYAFAIIIACGVVYNTARISVSERGRELATLRVIGFTRAEVSAILIGELMLVTLVAVPIGLAIGTALAWLLVVAFDSELYRIPLVITRGSYAQATLITLGAAFASALLVRRRLDRLDLVAVLKAKE